MLIGYSRVSSSSQDHASQIDALERAGCERIFVETASAVAGERAELNKLLAFARAGDELVVLRLDRLARNVRKLLEVVDVLQRREIGLRSLTEQIDTTSPAGRLGLHMLATLAQFEAERTRERCAAGRRVAIARGRMGGRPKSLDQTKLEIARTLMSNESLSMPEIAAQVGVAVSTLYRSMPGGRSALSEAT